MYTTLVKQICRNKSRKIIYDKFHNKLAKPASISPSILLFDLIISIKFYTSFTYDAMYCINIYKVPFLINLHSQTKQLGFVFSSHLTRVIGNHSNLHDTYRR
jgi:hypothetical protein